MVLRDFERCFGGPNFLHAASGSERDGGYREAVAALAARAGKERRWIGASDKLIRPDASVLLNAAASAYDSTRGRRMSFIDAKDGRWLGRVEACDGGHFVRKATRAVAVGILAPASTFEIAVSRDKRPTTHFWVCGEPVFTVVANQEAGLMTFSHQWGCGRIWSRDNAQLGTADADSGTALLAAPEGDVIVRLSPVHQSMRELITAVRKLFLYRVGLRHDRPRHPDLMLPGAEVSGLATTKEQFLIVTAFLLAVAYRVLWRPDSSSA